MKRTTFISVLLAMVFVATAAYAYWTFSTTVSANAIGTGEIKIQTWGGPISAAGLVPGEGSNVSYMAVQNIGTAPAAVKGFVNNGSGNTEIAEYINVKVTLNPSGSESGYSFANVFSSSNLEIFNGKLTELDDPAAALLTTQGHEPMPVGSGAVYKIEVSLDASAPNATKNKTMWCDFVWAAGQNVDAGFWAATSF